MTAVRLRIVSGADAGDCSPPHGSGRAQLCDAWGRLERWEHRAESDLGPEFAELVVVLWTVHRFAVSPAGMAVLDALLDDAMHLRRPDPLLEDVASLAFALGAAWATTDPPRHLERAR